MDHHGDSDGRRDIGTSSAAPDEPPVAAKFMSMDGNNNDASDKDDDDDHSTAASSALSSDDDHGPNKPTLLEIREQKMKRNQALLRSLGLGNLRTKNKRTEAPEGAVTEPGDTEEHSSGRKKRRRGMLLLVQWPAADAPTKDPDTTVPATSRTNHLYAKYPHRERELQKLLGLLRPVPCEAPHAFRPVPAPLFVVGPHGQGKTSVVVDVVQALGLPYAYLDCAVLDVPSLDELTRTAYSEFESQLAARRIRHPPSSTSRTRPKKKRKRVVDARSTEDPDPSTTTQQPLPSSQASSRESQETDVLSLTAAPADENDTMTAAAYHSNRSHLARSAAATFNTKPPPGTATTASTTKPAPSKVATPHASAGSTSSQTSAAKFGRDLAALFGDRHSGILVLDHAERLLSLPKVGSSNQPNYLAQLLLVPRTVGVQLTIVAITNSHLLENSRMRPLDATIRSILHPICIRFPTYKSRGAFKDVLRTEHVRRLITGGDAVPPNGASSDFRRAAFGSFVDTLVQSLQNTTLDVKEMIRVGRALWPKYIEPLSSPSTIARTLEAARKTLAPIPHAGNDLISLQRQILAILDRKLRPTLLAETASPNAMTGSVFSWVRSPRDSGSDDFPTLAKYLLLAAYLCQSNRPDRDKYLFSIEKNGRRRRRDTDHQGGGAGGSGGRDAEDGDDLVGGGGGAAAALSGLPRPRTFPLERLLSVYVSAVGLAASGGGGADECTQGVGPPIAEEALGSSALYETLAHLCDLGLLHEWPARSAYDTVPLTDARYWTSLAPEEARSMAASLQFPLDSYLR